MKSECKNPEILHSQINAAFKTTESKLNFFDAQKLKTHKISLKAITETYMMLNKKPKVSYAANLASKLGKQAKASRNRILSIMGQGKNIKGFDMTAKISEILDLQHKEIMYALEQMKEAEKLIWKEAMAKLWSHDIQPSDMRMIFKQLNKDEYMDFDRLCAIIKYEYNDVLRNERASDFVIATHFYFEDFECDQSIAFSLTEDEFVNFWNLVLDIYHQLDSNQGGDIGVVEVVRFLEKNSKRYNLNRKTVYSTTVHAFQTLDDNCDMTLSFIESYCFLPKLIKHNLD